MATALALPEVPRGPFPVLAAGPVDLSPFGIPDILVGIAYLVLAFFLWKQRTRPARPLGPVFAWLAAAVAGGGLAYALLALGSWAGGWEGVGKVVAAGLAGGGAVALLHLLRGDARRGDVARLRLLATAVSASGDGVMIAEVPGRNPHPRIVYANPAFERMTGYSTAEAVGQSPSILPDRDEPDSLAAVRAALRGTTPVRVEVPSRRKDGSRLWTEWQIVPVADDAGRYTHAVAVLRDTTDRRRAEQAVRDSENRFRALFEHAADTLFLLDPGGRIVDANRRACLTLGYTREEFAALAVTDLDTGYRLVDLEPGQTLTAENWYRRKDGTTFPAEVRFTALETGGRRLRLAMVRDVTRRLRTEQALREREELLRMVIAHIPCGVFWKDRRSAYLGCNDRVARDFGLTGSEQVVGRTDSDLCPDPADDAVYREGDQEVMATGEPLLNLEQDATRPGGGRIVLLTSKVPLRDATGQVVGVLGVYQDITDRKRLEEQFRQSQKLEAVGRLAGGIAHDFNNLLTVIRGNAELLSPAAGDADLVADLRDAADRAAGLVRQLLMFSRRQPSRPEAIDLNEVVAGLAGLLRRLLGERVAVDTRLAAAPVAARADRGHLEQVIVNLAVNARDAMPGGGTLTIATEAARGGPTARLTVADTGTGMTAEVKARIFEPFFTTKGPDKGTGLGLATAFGIVEQAGGRITVESQPGAGTTFHIDLPWCPDPVTPLPAAGGRGATPADPPEAPGRGHAVLLVEDEDAVRKLARMTLEGQGYAVTDAPDGETALDLLDRGEAVDLLVTDLTMPGIDGRELAGRVRRARPGVGVVFVSGYVPDIGRLDDLPGAVFLPKPFTPADLLRVAGKALPRDPAGSRPGLELSAV